MKTVNKAMHLGLAIAGLSFAGIASAEGYTAGRVPTAGIEACAAEIGGRANYEGADRVRHEVRSVKRRSLAHRLKIGTQVFGGDNGAVIREYTTTCVVYGDDRPVYFVIEENTSSS